MMQKLEQWMQGGKWRRAAFGVGLWVACMLVIFPAWIGTAMLLGSTERNAGGVALNIVLTCFIAVAGLPVMHRAMYRWFTHIEKKQQSGVEFTEAHATAYGSEPTAPVPHIDWPWPLRLRHALTYLLGILTLTYVFLPYQNQLGLARFINMYSAGHASARGLNSIVFFYLPMASMMTLAALMTWRQLRRRDAGLLNEQEKKLLTAEINWLFSFGAAYVMAVVLCRFAGGLIVNLL